MPDGADKADFFATGQQAKEGRLFLVFPGKKFNGGVEDGKHAYQIVRCFRVKFFSCAPYRCAELECSIYCICSWPHSGEGAGKGYVGRIHAVLRLRETHTIKFSFGQDAILRREPYAAACQVFDWRAAMPFDPQPLPGNPADAMKAGMVHVGDEEAQRLPGFFPNEPEIVGPRCASHTDVAGGA